MSRAQPFKVPISLFPSFLTDGSHQSWNEVSFQGSHSSFIRSQNSLFLREASISVTTAELSNRVTDHTVVFYTQPVQEIRESNLSKNRICFKLHFCAGVLVLFLT